MIDKAGLFVVTTTVITKVGMTSVWNPFTFNGFARNEDEAKRNLLQAISEHLPGFSSLGEIKTHRVSDEVVREAALAMGMKDP